MQVLFFRALYPSQKKKPSMMAHLLPFYVFGCICFSSCKKFVDIPPPINQVTASSVFVDDATATSSVSGVYANMMVSNLGFANGAFSLYGGLSSDEFVRTAPVAEIDAFTNNALTPDNFILNSSFWNRGYGTIYQINSCIEGLTAATQLTPTVRNQLLGESYFLRAYCYYFLEQFYGEVPLVLTTKYQENAVAGRSTRAVVLDQILKDLGQASSLLVTAYPTAGRIRANRSVAQALLARVHLLLGNWSQAEASATAVIANSVYQLEPDLNKVFLIPSTEVVLELMPVLSNINSAEGFTFLPSPFAPTTKPAYALTPSLLGAFEPGDKRKTAWVGSKNIGGQDYFYPQKFKTWLTLSGAISEHNLLIRLGEMYLIRAEARAQMGQLLTAAQDLNIIRSRAGLGPTTATDKVSMMAAIEQERRIELFSEQGYRWLDLKRWGRSVEVLKTKPGFQATDTLYPIPLQEIQRNPSLVQNPGY